MNRAQPRPVAGGRFTPTCVPSRTRAALIVLAWAGAVASASDASAQVTVSSSGQAAVSVPIAVPPGIAGMAPNLYLQYTDGGINGHLGVGWSLQGVSMITRCPATRIIDGKPRPVMFDEQDKLCLDGQRLIQTDAQGVASAQSNDALGVSGQPREYRTEKDTYARIRAYGIAGGSASNGPAYFKVWTKSGQVYEYGTDPWGNASSIVNAKLVVGGLSKSPPAVWAVSRISDAVGNSIDYKYAQVDVAWGSGPAAGGSTGHEWGISEIHYTGNGQQVPANKIVFAYESKPGIGSSGSDRAEAYQWDNKNVATFRINAIRMYINSPNATALGKAAGAVLTRTYKLSYESSPASGRSRLTSVRECSGPDMAETSCLPPTTFTYGAAGSLSFSAHATFGASPMRILPMMDATNGEYGVLTGDFNGDGRADILRWSRTAASNELWFSNGDGSFTKASAFNLTNQNLNGSNFNSTDNCYTGIVADFNGDGLSDILRTAKPGCSSAGNVLFLSNGNGSFSTNPLPGAIDLVEEKSYESCVDLYRSTDPLSKPPASTSTDSFAVPPTDDFGPTADAKRLKEPKKPKQGASRSYSNSRTTPSCGDHYQASTGRRFYILDLNGDGLLDIVTTVAPGYFWDSAWGPVPSEADLCRGLGYPAFVGRCSRVWLGAANGQFTEKTDTNIANTSVYSDPPDHLAEPNPYWRLPNQIDLDGDGLLDILATYTGRWRSTGDGNFTGSVIQDSSQLCGLPIDFNGDGRADCLRPDWNTTNQTLTLSYGATSSAPLAQFNLTAAADKLYATDGSGRQNVGVVVDDFDGDVRQDILRWGPTPGDNGIYLSNGDGSFRARTPAGLDSITRPLVGTDGKATFVVGDFLGIGSLQILHLKHSPAATGDITANTNQLYYRSVSPVDVLASATSPTGLVTTVGARVPLTNSAGRYLSDRDTPLKGTGNIVDIQAPMYVITSITRQTGAEVAPLTTEYLYAGLKAERGGRGLLGFREMRQQSPAPGAGELTVATEYLLRHPYAGVAATARTFVGGLALSGQLLSRTTNTYCDKSVVSPPTPTVSSPCASTALVTRPYLATSIEEGWELNGAALPTITTTNSYNDYGDPTQIVVTTARTTPSWVSVKTTTNLFCAPKTTAGAAACTEDASVNPNPNDISGDNWILGRLSKASVRSQVPNLAAMPTTTAGSAPNATAVSGQ